MNRFERSSPASIDAESVRSSTASQSSAVKRPRTDAPCRNERPSSSSERENLLAQVLDHEALVSSEPGHGPARVVDVSKPETGEDERSGPALGVLDQELDLLRSERDLPSLDEQLVRLRGGERQLVGAYFHERPACTRLRQLERGIRPCDEDQARVRRQVFQREVDRGKTLRVRRRLEVVQHRARVRCRTRRSRSSAHRRPARSSSPPCSGSATHPGRAPDARDRRLWRRMSTTETGRCHRRRA